MAIALLMLIVLFPLSSYAEVYKCQTDTGSISYSQTPCSTGSVHYDARRVSIGSNNSQTVTLTRGSGGIFHTEGSVNGMAVSFILDTGATLTTLSGDIAYRLGLKTCIPVGVVNTANGKSLFCQVVVNKLTIANFQFVNVTIAVNPQMRGEALFGNDLLKQFTINQQGNQLTLSR
jgi:clan AA aspartic protease (TIGR02281 family)